MAHRGDHQRGARRAEESLLSEPATAKRYLLGTHRVRSPEETWEGLRDVLPRAGITRLADITRLDRIGIPVWQAVRPASRNLAVSQGKGATPAAARASAAMEAIELWHAEDLGHLPHLSMSLREMRYDNAIPPSALRWASRPPEAAGMPIDWICARSRTGRRDGWLPRRMLELDSTEAPHLPLRLFNATSNGLASGNCLEEALLHGVCETIERHALYLLEREPDRKRIPLREDSIEVPWLREPIERVRAAGMKLALFDITWEAGVPVALVDLAAPDLPNIWRGSGCHPDPAVALSRALTEAAQARLTYISGARDDLPLFEGEERAWSLFDGFEEPPGLRSLDELPDLSGSSVAADLDAVVERLAARGLATWWVDLTRRDVGVPVAFTFVPGLQELPHD